MKKEVCDQLYERFTALNKARHRDQPPISVEECVDLWVEMCTALDESPIANGREYLLHKTLIQSMWFLTMCTRKGHMQAGLSFQEAVERTESFEQDRKKRRRELLKLKRKTGYDTREWWHAERAKSQS